LDSHEYENNVLVLKHCLETATNLSGIKTEVSFGWPTNIFLLEEADTVVITSGGSDRSETDHPLYVGDHFSQLEKQMQRGCGLVMFHWSVFHPTRHKAKILDWLGGYFDYETGTNGPTKKWFSKIEHATWPVLPAPPEHPLLRGIRPFELKDEFYYNIRFAEKDPHCTPILFKQEPKQENVIAWAVERKDGGRGFGFTCGHFYTNWWQPEFRKIVLNAIVWTAKNEVPLGGVSSSLENFQSPISRKQKTSAPAAKKLKPASITPDAGGKAKEEEWKDSRWNQMDTGQFLGSIVPTPNGIIAKGLSIRLGEHEEAAVVYDSTLCNVRAGWTGKFLTFDPARYGLINSPTISGEVQFLSLPGAAWNGKPHYKGLHLNGKRVTLSYELGEVAILETPWVEGIDEAKIFTRTFELTKSPSTQSLTVAELKESKPETNEIAGIRIVSLEKNGKYLFAAATGNGAGNVSAQNDRIALDIPGRTESKFCEVFLFNGVATDAKRFAEFVKQSPLPASRTSFTKGGAPRWGEALKVKGEPSLLASDAYVLDTLTVPYENPHKAMMFLSGVDFFSNGDAAVCSIHGDVWRVSGIDAQLQNIRWKRYATGLFQPLGLKIINDQVYVLGRDQITRLHDENEDGEADFYENFFNGIKTSIGGHDYVTSLETDLSGNLYYVDPVGLHRVSPDGKSHETVATGFRNPNGIGIGPNGVITVAPQEGNWTPSSAICEIKTGGFYGFGGPQFSSERLLGYDAPLCWIPRNIDNSTGSQVWVKNEQWGPLHDHMLNLSFGRCSMQAVLREVVDGVAQGGVVPLKPHFISGAMRGAIRKQDGQLYVVGSLGWATSASREGCFQRVRYTGKNAHLPTDLHIHQNGIQITFSEPLEKETAQDPGSYGVEQWNYLYSKDYGSKEYSVTQPKEIGHDAVDIKSVKLLPDGRTVFLEILDVKPSMQMQIQYNINALDGKAVRGEIYNTINKVGPAKTPI
jgi:type 1 glutamine amidotransferase